MLVMGRPQRVWNCAQLLTTIPRCEKFDKCCYVIQESEHQKLMDIMTVFEEMKTEFLYYIIPVSGDGLHRTDFPKRKLTGSTNTDVDEQWLINYYFDTSQQSPLLLCT
jgi:hypothetical protein